MANKKQSHAGRKQEMLRRRKRLDRVSSGRMWELVGDRKTEQQVGYAFELIRDHDFDQAEEVLQRLDSRRANNPQVLEALLELYQTTKDHAKCCAVANRLAVLKPNDPEMQLMVAQESMFCGWVAVARQGYEAFIDRWPDHEHASKAKAALEIVVPESERRIRDFNFPSEDGLRLVAVHERSLAALQNGDFSGCAANCRELLAVVPTFASSRNNLAIACFHDARQSEAIAVLEETLALLPENRFAQASLARAYFLSGRTEHANRLADRIVADPPTYQDALMASFEALALLGRDTDIVNLAQGASLDNIVDDDMRGMLYHYWAYATCRLGDEKSAKEYWKMSLESAPHLEVAQENLRDLRSASGHAPWFVSFYNWIPQDLMKKITGELKSKEQAVIERYPDIAGLIPALLDRGDPLGREFAKLMITASGSPKMLDALKDFAFGMRGPESMRFEALQFLRERRVIDKGPHKIFRQGKWAELQLLAFEVYDESENNSISPTTVKLLTAGMEAMRVSDLDAAESCFERAVKMEPNNCSAIYNLCAVWLERGRPELEQKARQRLEQLHLDFPEYPFAAIALAQFAGMRGDFQRAREILAPLYQIERMHRSEAVALFTAELQLAITAGDQKAAEKAYQLLCQFADANDKNLRLLKSRMEQADEPKGWQKMLSVFSSKR